VNFLVRIVTGAELSWGEGKCGEHHRCTDSSIIQTRMDTSSAFDPDFTHNPTRIPASTPSMSSTEQYSLPWYRPAMRYFLYGLQAATYSSFWSVRQTWKLALEIKVRSGIADLKIRSARSICFMDDHL
jgi:hypothetical protein